MPFTTRLPDNVDIIAMNNVGLNARLTIEAGDNGSYLNGLIEKPWGHEYRIYCDYLYDIWRLRLLPGQTTSMHCHMRKDTVLICLSGYGVTTFLDGTQSELQPGRFLYIHRGAFHSTEASEGSPLDLIEVENPRNKFDLVRLDDRYGRGSKGYENAATPHQTLEPMLALGTQILYRSTDLDQTHRFIISRLSHEALNDDDILYIVPIDIQNHLTGKISVLRPTDAKISQEFGSLSIFIKRAPEATRN